MFSLISDLIVPLYFLSAFLLMLYGINCYIMIFLFLRRRKAATARIEAVGRESGEIGSWEDIPTVTTQLPVYNELNVVERLMRAACAMRYPAGRHEIQVLDDSTDETRERVDALAAELRTAGHDIVVFRRPDRTGYKAGALAEGLSRAKGELVAVFDADFVPPADFLLRAVPFFLADERLGLVQARWTHLNAGASLLTRAQSIGIDGHFVIEQAARNWNDLYMNFNGTAGIWRATAILDAGGWQWDTLTEDMDLSYRVQFAGWRTLFLPDLEVPAEVPAEMNAFKSQQFRWAKGSIQTALKLFPTVVRQPVPPFKKLQAFVHLTHYAVHPIMLLLSLLAMPVLMVLDMAAMPVPFGLMAVVLTLSMLAPSVLYTVSQRVAHPDDWPRRIIFLPFLVIIGMGIAVSNARAVIEALMGRQSAFIRTPKRGDRELKRYAVRLPWVPFFEVAVGVYCAVSLDYYLSVREYFVGPFLAAYACGFLYVGAMTIAHGLGFEK